MGRAFKEWALICDALGKGTQSIILRKGGIAEDNAGFSFSEGSFHLFPTLFHEQVERLRLPTGTSIPRPLAGAIEIALHATTVHTAVLDDWETIRRLEPFHLWRPEIVRERFEYDNHDEIHLAIVRISRLNPPWILPDSPSFGGCKSWIEMPEPPAATSMIPVLPDNEFNRLADRILEALSSPHPA
jgi:hypothetical protein